jgi:hypothetical protein
LFSEGLEDNILSGGTDDSVFDARKVDRIEKLYAHDFVNFSGIELKLSLLFGLKTVYRNFIVSDQTADGEPGETVVTETQKQQSLWFIQKRRGCVFVEMPLLYQNFQFQFLITDSETRNVWQCNATLDYAHTTQMITCMSAMDGEALRMNLEKSKTLLIAGEPVQFTMSTDGQAPGENYHRIKGTALYYLVRVINPETGMQEIIDVRDIHSKLEFIFPDFVNTFSDYTFNQRLKYFLENELPVNAVHRVSLVRGSLVGSLITAYVEWHESMRCNDLKNYPNPASVDCAWRLLIEIFQTYTPLTA